MQLKNNKVFQYVAVPLMAAGFYLALIYVYDLLGLPSSEEIINSVEKYYEQYGYWIVLLGVLAEGILLINWYLPGSVVIAFGVVFAKRADLSVTIMLLLVILGFMATSILNYALGRFGWYHVFLKLGLRTPLEKVKSKVESKGLRILFTTYIHPNFSALSATAAGILKLPFAKFFFYSLICIIFWNSLWTLLFYHFGDVLLRHVNLLIIAGGIFVYFMFAKSFKEERVNIP
jgi:membrane-associated protein